MPLNDVTGSSSAPLAEPVVLIIWVCSGLYTLCLYSIQIVLVVCGGIIFDTLKQQNCSVLFCCKHYLIHVFRHKIPCTDHRTDQTGNKRAVFFKYVLHFDY